MQYTAPNPRAPQPQGRPGTGYTPFPPRPLEILPGWLTKEKLIEYYTEKLNDDQFIQDILDLSHSKKHNPNTIGNTLDQELCKINDYLTKNETAKPAFSQFSQNTSIHALLKQAMLWNMDTLAENIMRNRPDSKFRMAAASYEPVGTGLSLHGTKLEHLQTNQYICVFQAGVYEDLTPILVTMYPATHIPEATRLNTDLPTLARETPFYKNMKRLDPISQNRRKAVLLTTESPYTDISLHPGGQDSIILSAQTNNNDLLLISHSLKEPSQPSLSAYHGNTRIPLSSIHPGLQASFDPTSPVQADILNQLSPGLYDFSTHLRKTVFPETAKQEQALLDSHRKQSIPKPPGFTETTPAPVIPGLRPPDGYSPGETESPGQNPGNLSL